jgi:phosphatidate cytidylyltransferase
VVESTGRDAMADPAPIEPVPAPRREPRAGRNLPLAIVTGLVLAGALLASLFISRPAFVGFLLVIVVLALLELLAVLGARAMRPARAVVLAMAGVLVVGAYLEGPAALSFGLLLTILAAFAWYLVDRSRTEVTRNVGVLLGRHPMAPAVSPNKSWEGAAGASVACLLAGAFMLPLWEPWSLAPGLALAAVTCVVAPLGDLSESMLKRDLAVKDMGSLLPGHGGMLDRVDALLFMAPALYYVMAWFNLLRTP